MRSIFHCTNSAVNCLMGLLLSTVLPGRFAALAQPSPPTAQQVRAAMIADLEQPKIPLVDVFKTEVRKVWTGTDSISIQIYYPSAKRNLPIIYKVHGGAFIMRILDINVARILCNRTQSVVVTVDYRVAPEHPFPASINDCYAVWNWIVRQAGQIGGNRQKISLAGDSAGGCIIAALQVKRQQEGHPERPLAMVFINPGLDLRPGAPGEADYRKVVTWYLNGADPTNPLVSPILNDKLSGYPPSLIITGENDVLKPQGTVLADKLKASGVPTQLVDLRGVGHLGYNWLSATPRAQPAIDAVVSFLNGVNAGTSKQMRRITKK